MTNPLKKSFDIIIVGAGPVGITLALALAHLPINIAIVEAKPWQANSQWQGKSLALNYASQQLLSALHIWPQLSAIASPIQTVHISEQGQFGRLNFRASELDLPALGYLVPEPQLISTLEEKIKQQTNLTWFKPAEVKSWCYIDQLNQLTIQKTTDIDQINAPLLIAADGAHSSLRQACGIEAVMEDYQQSALVTQVSVSHPNSGTAFQRFTPEGTIALLPLLAQKYGLIITAATEQINIWETYIEPDFLQTLQDSFGYRLGRFTAVTQRLVYPLKKVVAKQQSKSGVILLGNAAHAFHPVAAQGLNLSLQDVAALAEIIEQQGWQNISAIITDYEAWRLQEQKHIMTATEGIVSVFNHPSSLIKHARHWGLALLAYTPPLKQLAAKHACGLGGRLAKLLRQD